MIKNKFCIIVVFLFSILQFVNSQTIDVVRSQNKEYFLYNISYKYENYLWRNNIFDTVYKKNKIVVFNSDSLIKYEIPWSIDISYDSHLFLSNDGDYIVNVFDGYDDKSFNAIEIFEKGVLTYSFRLQELIKIDTNWDTKLFFSAYTGASFNDPNLLIFDTNATAFERKITKTPCYIFNDTIYIYTKTNELLILDFKSGKFKKESFSYINEERFSQFNSKNRYTIVNNNKIKDLNLVENINFNQSLANLFDMNVDENNSYTYYKTYTIQIGLLIDSKGNPKICKLENRSSIDSIKIINFIDSIKFFSPNLPKGVDFYLFETTLTLISKDLKKARIDKIASETEISKKFKKLRQYRISADSLNGIYIPFDLYDCFKHLDLIISQRDIESIENFEYSKEYDFRYIGLSIWIKENWIIGPGSTRLSYYFKQKGLKSYDDMTSVVIDSYFKYLRKEKFNENKIIKKIKLDRKNNTQIKEKIKEIKKTQNVNIDQLQADSINGKYIPKNLEDCFYYLDRILSEKDIQALKNNENLGSNFFSIGFCYWADTDLTAHSLSRLSFDILRNGYRYYKTDQCLILEKYRLYLQNGFRK